MAHPLAGKPVPSESLIDTEALIAAYFDRIPDPALAAQQVAFGTSGHRGSSLTGSFNEAHLLAITQAVCELRASRGITGPLYVGKDTHGLSGPAQRSVLEVLAANGVATIIQENDGFTPTPAISRAILAFNRETKNDRKADGLVITPSHNPPEDGGIKYNPENGGPADTDLTGWIQDRANALLRGGNKDVKRLTYEAALRSAHVKGVDLVAPYVEALPRAVDLAAIAAAGVRIGIDPLGGAALAYWERLADRYKLALTLTSRTVDPRFAFMTLDHDGKIRMDCSSPYAMARLVGMKEDFQVACGNDADADRHGIVVPGHGLLNPNHYLAVAIEYLFSNRPGWPKAAAIGKTAVSSALIDRVAGGLGRKVVEVPVGFKWFVGGLLDGSLGFGGEESAGASFLDQQGLPFSTDKDGLIPCLLAAEMIARTGQDPGQRYVGLVKKHGAPLYTRIDAPATPDEKARLKNLDPSAVAGGNLAGEAITAALTRAPGNNAALGGLKVIAENGWFAARPSGTENLYKIYAESFIDAAHLERIVADARALVSRALGG